MIALPDSGVRSRKFYVDLIKYVDIKIQFLVLNIANSRLVYHYTFSFPAFPFQTLWCLCKSLRDDTISPSFITFVFFAGNFVVLFIKLSSHIVLLRVLL